MKPGDFVFFAGDGQNPSSIALVVRAEVDVLLRCVDGRSMYAKPSECQSVDLRDVANAIDAQQSLLNRRLYDIQEIQRAAFERALKAGR